MKKKMIITFLGLFFAMVVFSAVALNPYHTGVVTSITADTRGSNDIELKITYLFPMGGYAVRQIAEDEGEYWGDGIKAYDGSIGKYRILINFGDVEPHNSLVKMLADQDDFTLWYANVLLKAKIVHPSDHGFALYIGSDQPISVENVEAGRLEGFCGTIKIPILLGEEE